MLPSTEALSGVPTEVWPKLKRRLGELGVSVDGLVAAQAPAAGIQSGLRGPILKWHLRRRSDEGAHALRCLFFNDAISSEAARRIFGPLLEPLQRGGVLDESPDGIKSPYHWDFVGERMLLADPLSSESETVMGHSQTTERLCRAATPTTKLGRVLDLGCGAGAIALVLAEYADQVVATDINERAVVIARINLAINGIGNVEVRHGDLFEPVRSERFDLIVSQPPFIAKPETADVVTFLYGGARGDELAARILGGVSNQLTSNGRAVMLVEWPEVPGEQLEVRIREALGDASKNLLVIQSPQLKVDEHCAIMATTVSRDPSSLAYEQDVVARRDHFARLGVEFLRSTFVIAAPSQSETPWTKLADARMSYDVVVDAAAIRRLEAAATLLSRGVEALTSAKLRLPEGTELREVSEDGVSVVDVVLPSDRLISAQRVNLPTASVLEWVNASEDVGQAIEQILRHGGNPSEAAGEAMRRELLATLARMLDVGLLEVA